MPRKTGVGIVWLYGATVVLWFVLHLWLGDTVWWLALLSTFAPFFFTPLVLLLPACLIWRQRALWGGAVLPLAIFLWLYGGLFLPTRSVPAGEGKPITVMSFNVWGYSHSKETARAILADGTPDVVALQELSPEMASVLIEEIGDVYPYHVLSIGARAYGLGVFSRYPLTQLDTSHLSDPNWRVQALRVEADDRHFILYNVHLQVSNVLGYLETGASAAKEVEASVRGRESQVRRLVADIGRRSEPVVVAGDFNSTDQSDGYRILSKCLTDAYRKVGWGFGHTFPAYGGSWHGLPILPREMRIDMIFCSDEFVPLRCEVGTAHGESDHLPVIARLDWRR